jgi:hypothetical protein
VDDRKAFLKSDMAAAVAATVTAAKPTAEAQKYYQRADPHELVNLAGRQEYCAKADELRGKLKQLMVRAGEVEPAILTAKLYPVVRIIPGVRERPAL